MSIYRINVRHIKSIFVPSNNEDFQYLDKIRKNNYKMVISPYVTYLVRDCQQPHRKEGNRVKINF